MRVENCSLASMVAISPGLWWVVHDAKIIVMLKEVQYHAVEWLWKFCCVGWEEIRGGKYGLNAADSGVPERVRKH